MFVFQTVLEFSVAIFIVWGLFNEKKLMRFEDRIYHRIKRRRAMKSTGRVYRSEKPHDNTKYCA